MYKPLAVFMGIRYMRATRKSSFISFISTFTVLGLMIGTSVLILVLSVMNGFGREINTRILGAVPHISMYGRAPLDADQWHRFADEIMNDFAITNAAPFVQLEGMLLANDQSNAVLIHGVLPEIEVDMSIYDDFMQQGRLEDLQGGDFSIVLGSILADSLNVIPGDDLVLVVPEINNSPIGTLPRIKSLKVSGIYNLRSELDAGVALIHIDDASVLSRLGGSYEGIRLKANDVFDAPTIRRSLIRDYNEEFFVSDWTSRYGNLFAAIELEKRLVGLLLFLIIAVASFNMVSALVMLVNDKRSDIAILRTMGADRKTIISIFMVNGALAGTIGTISGIIAGVALSFYISDIVETIEGIFAVDFLSADTYFIDFLPSQLLLSDVLIVSGATLVLSVTVSIYPALRAANIQPAEALRYE